MSEMKKWKALQGKVSKSLTFLEEIGGIARRSNSSPKRKSESVQQGLRNRTNSQLLWKKEKCCWAVGMNDSCRSGGRQLFP